jgi:sugar lactone lactonase YvrE
VSTIAGRVGYCGTADGTNGAARFSGSQAIAVDDAGNLFLAEGSSVIRKISSQTSAGQTNWVVETIAGVPSNPGNTDGVGSAAQFSDPWAVAVGPTGTLFVADTFNNTIRQLCPLVAGGQTNWSVSTIAGSPFGLSGTNDGIGSDALFNRPGGIAADAGGTLYVADSQNYTIRTITPVVSAGQTNWVVTTIAGMPGVSGSADGTGSAAGFAFPTRIALDRPGNLFVVEPSNFTLRKVSPGVSGGQTTWTVSTIAGKAGMSGAQDGAGNQARFMSPYGVSADSAGNLLVADGDTIRQITPTASAGQTNWVVRTIAGLADHPGNADGWGIGGEAPFNSPWGIAWDNTGRLFVTDAGHSVIRTMTPIASALETNWLVTTIAGLPGNVGSANGTGSVARFYGPNGIVADGAGGMFVVDSGNYTIRRVSPSISADQTNWAVSTIAGLAGHPGSADGTNSVARFRFGGFGPCLNGIALDSSGNLYVADTANYTIRRVALSISAGQTNWSVTTIAGLAGASGSVDAMGGDARFTSPEGIAADLAGNLYVCDYNTIRELSPVGPPNSTNWMVSTLAGSPNWADFIDGTGIEARFQWPHGIVTDNSNHLFVVDNGPIRKLALSVSPGQTNWVVSTIAGGTGYGCADGIGAQATFFMPIGITIDSAGTLYVADNLNNEIRMGWLAPLAPPYIVLSPPQLDGGEIQISFVVTSGWASSFQLLETPRLGGAWSTNTDAALTPNIPGVSYTFSAPYPGGAARFYRVSSP